MPTINANNCQMYYELDDYTDPWAADRQTIWLQHGVGRSSKFWYHWVPALASNYRVVRRDMRGHGQSSAPPPNHDWSIDELIEDMRAFLDALGLQQVHYLGESIGGILGIAFAAKWPERFKSLTVCSSPTAIRPSSRRALTGSERELGGELERLGGGGWVKILIEQKVISGKNPEHIKWVINEWSRTPTHVLRGINRMLASADIAPLLPQVKVPTLVLAPSRSPLTSLSDQLTIRNSIPNARMAVVEGPGHEIYVDEPEECINAFLKFLRSRDW
jgi:pimeloyl-ACP methyl ester carboxylesterase